MIIGLCGKARSGKDTIADLICTEMNGTKLSFASPLKAGIRAMFGLDDRHLEGNLKEDPIPWLGNRSPRFLMQTLGTEWGRDIVYQTLWTDLGLRKAQDLLKDKRTRNKCVVFSDVRFDTEAAAITEAGGVVIQVTRPDAQQVASHASEAGVNIAYIYHQITNDGTMAELKQAVKELCNEMASHR